MPSLCPRKDEVERQTVHEQMEDVTVEEVMQKHPHHSPLPQKPLRSVWNDEYTDKDRICHHESHHTAFPLDLLWSSISLLIMRVAYTFDTYHSGAGMSTRISQTLSLDRPLHPAAPET